CASAFAKYCGPTSCSSTPPDVYW
nr:immunoglobulin heavy chain junction region [Macaca mulatta]MOV54422.1 immunoglobulin heavy chain junction region [Macaca mulatta]MOV54481.1 immunoglobulin heavy chain junction region [Macaca mulatta]MOV54899.1 immunoglobulin heavy chain junction region [Macaca mulatta]MOV55251.1 immunoglobulin heavy chain junction region [Macaca mulatta]